MAVLLSGGLLSALAGAGQAPSRVPPLDTLLSAVGKYLQQWEMALPAIVAEETYTQRARFQGSGGAGTRTLRSDVLTIADDEYGWISFRDVFEVDGRAIRDRNDRLRDLFLKPRPDQYEQARRIVEEGARFNLNVRGYEVHRTINMPLEALRFFRAREQPRSRFRLGGQARVDDVPTIVLDFEERGRPRMIASEDGAAARGRVWVEPVSGRVRRSELWFDTTPPKEQMTVRARVRVTYGRDEHAAEFVPVALQEDYQVGPVTLDGTARYSNFRRFSVETRTHIKRN